MYTVQEGDTEREIAERFGLTEKELTKLNSGRRPAAVLCSLSLATGLAASGALPGVRDEQHR